jgi:polyisoprenyl-phosphate glycosyltransferase
VSPTPVVSIVLPVYRNRSTLEELHRRLVRTLESLGHPFEIIFVSDASPDGSLDVLHALVRRDVRVQVVALDSRLGQHAALRAGLASSRGEVVVTMDADLQDPPEAIPALLTTLADGYGAVYAGRRGRYEPLPRLVSSWVFKHAISLVTGMPADAGAFIAMRRHVVARVAALPDRAPFIAAAVAWTGRPVATVPVVRDARPGGTSSYTAGMRLRTGASALAQAIRWRFSGVARS